MSAKHAAMAAHGSQIGVEYLDPQRFPAAYGREWFVRTGDPVIEPLLDGLSLGAPVPAGHDRLRGLPEAVAS